MLLTMLHSLHRKICLQQFNRTYIEQCCIENKSVTCANNHHGHVSLANEAIYKELFPCRQYCCVEPSPGGGQRLTSGYAGQKDSHLVKLLWVASHVCTTVQALQCVHWCPEASIMHPSSSANLLNEWASWKNFIELWILPHGIFTDLKILYTYRVAISHEVLAPFCAKKLSQTNH